MRLTMLALASLPSLPTAVDDEHDPPHPPEPEPEPDRHPNPKDEPMALSEADVRRIEAAAAKRSRRRARNLATR